MYFAMHVSNTCPAPFMRFRLINDLFLKVQMVFQFIKANWNHMSTRAYLGYNRESGTENLSDTPNKKRVQHFHTNPIEREKYL